MDQHGLADNTSSDSRLLGFQYGHDDSALVGKLHNTSKPHSTQVCRSTYLREVGRLFVHQQFCIEWRKMVNSAEKKSDCSPASPIITLFLQIYFIMFWLFS